MYRKDSISIHAPMKGATFLTNGCRLGGWISIHAPMKGATLCLCRRWYDSPHFNPRTHEGCDQGAEDG